MINDRRGLLSEKVSESAETLALTFRSDKMMFTTMIKPSVLFQINKSYSYLSTDLALISHSQTLRHWYLWELSSRVQSISYRQYFMLFVSSRAELIFDEKTAGVSGSLQGRAPALN